MAEPKIDQVDFSAGMFRGVAPAMVPRDGALDIEGLLTEAGAVAQRGGTAYLSTDAVDDLHGVYSGELATGLRTVLFREAGVSLLNVDGTTTVLTVTDPRRARPAGYLGGLYWSGGSYDGTTVGASLGATHEFAAVAGRLFRASDTSTGLKVEFTSVGGTTFGATDFHLLSGVDLRGIYPLRDSLAVFTNRGIYVISGLASNLTDADGNVQHRVDLYSDDVVLEGSSWGICGFEGGLIVPAEDGVWMISLGITSEAPLPLQKISGAIDGLWNGWDFAYQGGQAIVHDGHYLIPVVVSNEDESDIDNPLRGEVLVCKLDARDSRGGRRFPWSRLRGQGANVTAIGEHTDELGETAIVASTRFVASGVNRLLTCAWFTWQQAVLDADGSLPRARVVLRDAAMGALNMNTAVKVRVGYALTDGTVTAQASTAPTSLIAVRDVGDPLVALAGSGDESTETKTFPIAKMGRFVRVAVTAQDSVVPAVIRTAEIFMRAGGRQ